MIHNATIVCALLCSELSSEFHGGKQGQVVHDVADANKERIYSQCNLFIVMHQSFETPAPTGPQIAGTYRGLSAGI